MGILFNKNGQAYSNANCNGSPFPQYDSPAHCIINAWAKKILFKGQNKKLIKSSFSLFKTVKGWHLVDGGFNTFGGRRIKLIMV